MDRSRSVSRDFFEWSLAAAVRYTRIPHFIAVHAVDDLQPGLYPYPALDAPLRLGDLRDELFSLSDEQELTRDASFVVIATANLEELDDRGYRDSQLDAGLVSGRLHLAAFARGIGATGMTFRDSEIRALLGEPLTGLLLTCIGAPTYRHRAGGPPGQPTQMRPLKQPSP
jgi:nitroreductase